MKEKIVDYKKDLEQKLREAFADMKREERVEVLNNVLNHLLALDFVQQMEYRLRMVFWKCCASKGSCLVIQVPSTKM